MISAEQKVLRRKYCGSSDAPIIMGVSPYGRTAGDLWLEKTGRLEEKQGETEEPQFRRGRLLEPSLIQALDEHLGVKGERDKMLLHRNGIMAANLDAIYPNLPVPAIGEAKSSTHIEGYGEDGTDQAPEHVLVQVAHQMCVTGYALAYIPVILPLYGRFSMPIFRVERNQELCEIIEEAECDWWNRYVKTDTPPPEVPSLETLKIRKRALGKSVPIAREVVMEYDARRAEAKFANEELEKAKASIVNALGDAEIGESDSGTVSYKSQKRAAYQVAESEFRVLRLKTK